MLEQIEWAQRSPFPHRDRSLQRQKAIVGLRIPLHTFLQKSKRNHPNP
jgi:hypothetical protein